MSLTSTSAAIERDDAAVDGSPPQTATVLRRDLADLAAALARVEALVAADAVPEPAACDAIERIADIAFVLHERDVEASLCDALDAAVREIGAVSALKQQRAQRARQAVEMLHDLSHRIKDVIARSHVLHHGAPAAARVTIEDAFAQKLAPLAGGSPPPAGDREAGSAPRRDADVVAALPSAHAQPMVQAAGRGAATMADGAVKARPSAAVEVTVSAGPPDGLSLDEDPLLPAPPNEAAISPKSALSSEASRPGEVPSGREAAIAPAASIESHDVSASEGSPRLLDPDDDPDDLFEPAANLPPAGSPEPAIGIAGAASAPRHGSVPRQDAVAAGNVQLRENAQAAVITAGAKSADTPSRAGSSTMPDPRLVDAPIPQSASRAAPSDPLAPLGALSEEEMIALFS